MRYTLRQLEYFIAAGETLSITQASERIHISQPSISAAIAHLERELGVPLFVRHHAQGLSLTPAGRRLLHEARLVVEHAQGLQAVASELSGQIRGPLNVGCLVTIAPMVIPELCQGFMQAFPETRIEQREAGQEELLLRLRRAELDVVITYDLQIPDEVAFEPLAVLPAHVVVSEGDELARRGAVTLGELAERPLILLDLPVSREYFLSLFAAAGVAPTIRARSAHPEVVRSLVANGFGYGLANVRPRSELALDGRRLVRVRLSGEHRAMRLGLATTAGLRKSRLLQAFEQRCRSFISDAYVPGMAAPDGAARVRRRAGP